MTEIPTKSSETKMLWLNWASKLLFAFIMKWGTLREEMVFSGSHVGRSFSKSYQDLNENYHHYLQRVDCFFREIFLRNLVLPFTRIYLFILNVDASRNFNICYFSELVLLLVVFLEFEQGE